VTRPAVFIASSRESVGIAEAVHEQLESHAEVTVWKDNFFQPSQFALESLVVGVNKFDFAIFVFAADDVAVIRNKTHNVARDNVVFELGLFIGALGREQCFILTPRGETNLHLPSDLAGLTPIEFDDKRTDGNMVAAVGPATTKIKRAMESRGQTNVKRAEQHPAPVSPIDAGDAVALIRDWLTRQPNKRQGVLVSYAELDRELKMPEGHTRQYLGEAMRQGCFMRDSEGSNFCYVSYNGPSLEDYARRARGGR